MLFLHRLQPGGADRSYGIEVGRLAGLPGTVLARARKVLELLEGEQLVPALAGRDNARVTRAPRPAAAAAAGQLALFDAEPHPVLARLTDVDPDTLTPLQALQLLAELHEMARAGHGTMTGRPA